MSHAPIHILANLDDVVKVLAPIVVFVFWAIVQVVKSQAKAANKQGPARGPRGPAAGRPRPAAQPRQARPDELSDEIETFLRRAAERRGEKPPGDVEVIEPVKAEPMQPQPVAARQQMAGGEPILVAKVVDPQRPQSQPARQRPGRPQTSRQPAARSGGVGEPMVLSGKSVAEHVQHHVSTGQLEEHLRHLGEEVEQSDERLEQRLHATFDHKLGQLTSTPTAIGDATVVIAEPNEPELPLEVDLGAVIPARDVTPVSPMFSGIEDLRRAIVLNEILRRPEW